MPRIPTLTSDMLTAIAAESGTFCHLLELDFYDASIPAATTAYFSTSSQDVTWGGITYVAVGGMIAIESITESPDLSSPGVDLVASGVNTNIIAYILTSQFVGRVAKVYLAHFASNGTIVADPQLMFQGYMNGHWEITEKRTETGGTVDVRTRLTDRLAGLEQRRGIQTNLGSHQFYYPGDFFFSLVGTLASTPVVWGGS